MMIVKTTLIRLLHRLHQLLIMLLVLPIIAYQKYISPYTKPACRYYPTCSHYALQSLRKHGLFYGAYLSIKRILRCHPWAKGGVDLVP